MIKLKPLNGYVFITLVEPKQKGLIVTAPRWKHESSLGVVTCVGNNVNDVSAGDIVQIAPSSYREINVGDETLLAVHISDIFAIIDNSSINVWDDTRKE